VPSDDQRDDDAVANSLIWGGAAYVGSRHPELAVVVDATAGYLSTYSAPVVAQLRGAASLIMRRRGDRVARVLVDAAARADIDIDEVTARLAGDEQREQLLMRTLEAAAGTAMESWLPLYATALANGTVADDLGVVSWETTFVRVVSDLDGAHMLLLDLFTRTANELGLGNGEPDFDKPVEVLSEVSLEIAAPDLPNHVALFASGTGSSPESPPPAEPSAAARPSRAGGSPISGATFTPGSWR
jgi:hypothetical protein